MKKPWELSYFVVSYRSVKYLRMIRLLGAILLVPVLAQVETSSLLWAQNSFSVQPKRSGSKTSPSQLESKAKAKASSIYKAQALSAQAVGKQGGGHLYKVKLRKNGRIFFKTVKVN